MNLPPFCDIKKPHVYVSAVEIVIRNNDYSQFMIQTNQSEERVSKLELLKKC